MFGRKKKPPAPPQPARYGIYVYTVDEKTWRSPLTEDRESLQEQLDQITVGLVDGTVFNFYGDVLMVDKIVGLEIKQYVRPYIAGPW